MKTEILFERLAGSLITYVENYFLSNEKNNTKFKIKPSYAVNYEIPESILTNLKKSVESDDIDNIWYHQISGCKNINELPDYLQKLIAQYLPMFLKQYPQYNNADCLALLKG